MEKRAKQDAAYLEEENAFASLNSPDASLKSSFFEAPKNIQDEIVRGYFPNTLSQRRMYSLLE